MDSKQEKPKGLVSTSIQLFKPRLSLTVVISAVFGFLFATPLTASNWMDIIYLALGGFLVTGSSNTINQILEKDLDAKMNRTKERPLPLGNITVSQAWNLSILCGAIGISLLYFGLNLKAALLGFSALVSYAFIYTPLKQKTPFAVFIGAFPGAVPPMLGWVAATNHFGIESGLLFAIQFMWQFPHFWAIAWVLDDDYNSGGFRLLPSEGGRDKTSAFQILIYTLFLLPLTILPWAFELTGLTSLIAAIVLGIGFTYYAVKLYNSCAIPDAKKLMFSSFLYLPILQLIFVLDKL